jgi:hypothetical protein
MLAETMSKPYAGAWNTQHERRKIAGMVGSFVAKLVAEGRQVPNGPAAAPRSNGGNREAQTAPEEPSAPAESLLIWHGDLPLAPVPSLIEELLPERGVAFVAGQTGNAKTFCAMDLAISVITGLPFAGRKVCRQGGVLWFAAEAPDDVAPRLEGIIAGKLGEEWVGRRLPFAQAVKVPTLKDLNALRDLIAHADECSAGFKENHGDLPLAVIIIDTLTAASGFEDENSASEVQKVLKVLHALSRHTKALVLVIDHYGKITETGVRGSSAKMASADTVLAFLSEKDAEGNISNRRMSLVKSRRTAAGQGFPFKLRKVGLAGFQDSTCVVDWDERAIEPTPRPARSPWTGKARILRGAIEAAIAEHGAPLRPFGFDGPEVIAVERKRVRAEFDAIYAADSDAKPDTKRRTFSRLVDEALAKGLIMTRSIAERDWIWSLGEAGQTGQKAGLSEA